MMNTYLEPRAKIHASPLNLFLLGYFITATGQVTKTSSSFHIEIISWLLFQMNTLEWGKEESGIYNKLVNNESSMGFGYNARKMTGNH